MSEINLVTQFRGVRMCPWPVTFVPCRSIFWRPCHLQVASCPLLYASACWALPGILSPHFSKLEDIISIESKANVMIPSSAWSHLNILKHIKTPKEMHWIYCWYSYYSGRGVWQNLAVWHLWCSVSQQQLKVSWFNPKPSRHLHQVLRIALHAGNQGLREGPVEILWNPMKSYEIPRDSCWILLVWGVTRLCNSKWGVDDIRIFEHWEVAFFVRKMTPGPHGFGQLWCSRSEAHWSI